jgi:hypothetical protein
MRSGLDCLGRIQHSVYSAVDPRWDMPLDPSTQSAHGDSLTTQENSIPQGGDRIGAHGPPGKKGNSRATLLSTENI